MIDRRYHKLKDEGRCVTCGCRLPEDWTFVKCAICIEINRSYKKAQKPKHEGMSLDEMAKEAHDKHLTYGQLQALKMKEGK
jgi:hypothetical protein